MPEHPAQLLEKGKATKALIKLLAKQSDIAQETIYIYDKTASQATSMWTSLTNKSFNSPPSLNHYRLHEKAESDSQATKNTKHNQVHLLN